MGNIALQKWFEKKFLNWQLENGRSTIEEYAKILGISQAYLTMLMNGERDNIRLGTAHMIAERINDYSLLDILGYARPVEEIPSTIRTALNKAQEEIATTLRDAGIKSNDPRALEIANGILQKYGLRFVEPPPQQNGNHQ